MNRIIRVVSLLVVFLFTLGILSACGENKNQDSESAAQSAGDTPAEDTKKTADSTGSTLESIKTNKTDILIDTAYGTLYYPLQWKDYFSYEISEDDPYTVKFLGKISEKNTVELFSIVFGEKGDIHVGEIVGDNACKVYVSPVTEINKKWNDDEVATFQAMQEDLNYTIEKLTKIKAYTKAG